MSAASKDTLSHEASAYVSAEALRLAGRFIHGVKSRSYQAMQLSANAVVLDVGCGAGVDTVPMARIVAPSGAVVGIDKDLAMVKEANAAAAQTGVAELAKHCLSNAHALPFEAETFDACRADRLLQHVPEPESVLAEMRRVTKRRGWVVVVDSDHYSVSIASPVPQIERKFVKFRAESFQNGTMGRELLRYLKEASLDEVSVELFPLVCHDYAAARCLKLLDEEIEREAVQGGALSEAELQLFISGLEEWDRHGFFYFAGCMVLARGRRAS